MPESQVFLLQFLLEGLVNPGMEEFAENSLTLFGVGKQELQEIPLGNHGNLRKLVPVDTQDVPDLSIYIRLFCDYPAVRKPQFGFRTLTGKPAPALCRALVLRVPADGVGFPRIGELQFHEGRRFRAGIFGTKHARTAHAAAGLAVQGKGNGVEDGGLPCPGIPGDQVQAAPAEGFKVDFGPARIGAERGDCQLQRSHASTSRMRSNRPVQKASCSAERTAPFCFS